MHWAERYVGLPFKKKGRDRKGLDCYGLVRLVIAEQCATILPRWDQYDDPRRGFVRESKAFEAITVDQVRVMDCVFMNEDVKTATGWAKAPIHIGIIVMENRILHIREGLTSCVEDLPKLDCVSALRNPFYES